MTETNLTKTNFLKGKMELRELLIYLFFSLCYGVLLVTIISPLLNLGIHLRISLSLTSAFISTITYIFMCKKIGIKW